MAKRRLQKILDLSCANNNNNSNYSGDPGQNIQSFADIISSSTIVFDEHFYSDGNIDTFINSDISIDNEVLAFPIDDNAIKVNCDQADQNFVTEENENINNVVILAENELEYYNVDGITLPFEINNSTIEICTQENNITDNIENQVVEQHNIKSKNIRSIKPKPDMWKRKTSQKLRMNGDDYIGYQRKGNVVFQDVTRSARKI